MAATEKQHLFSVSRVRHIGLWCAMLFFALFEQVTEAATTKPFIIACSIPPEHESHKPVSYAYRQMLNPHHFRVVMHNVPPVRTFHLLHHGQADAICLVSRLSLRQFGRQQGFTLDVTLGQSDINAWTINPQVRLSEQIVDNRTSLHIGYLKNHTADFFLQQQGFSKGIAVKDVSMAAKMMISGRLEVMLMIETADYEHTLRYWLEKQESGSSHPLRGYAITNVHYVPYLHPRHRGLKVSLETTLRQTVAEHRGPISRDTIQSWIQSAQ